MTPKSSRRSSQGSCGSGREPRRANSLVVHKPNFEEGTDIESDESSEQLSREYKNAMKLIVQSKLLLKVAVEDTILQKPGKKHIKGDENVQSESVSPTNELSLATLVKLYYRLPITIILIHMF